MIRFLPVQVSAGTTDQGVAGKAEITACGTCSSHHTPMNPTHLLLGLVPTICLSNVLLGQNVCTSWRTAVKLRSGLASHFWEESSYICQCCGIEHRLKEIGFPKWEGLRNSGDI